MIINSNNFTTSKTEKYLNSLVLIFIEEFLW